MSALRLRVHTWSGSIYRLDREAMTWERMNNNLGHEEIIGLPGVGNGLLAEWTDPIVGSSLHLDLVSEGWIRTTPVVMVEDIT